MHIPTISSRRLLGPLIESLPKEKTTPREKKKSSETWNNLVTYCCFQLDNIEAILKIKQGKMMELKMLRVDATKSRNQAKKELDEVGEMFLDSWLMFCPWSPIQHHFFFVTNCILLQIIQHMLWAPKCEEQTTPCRVIHEFIFYIEHLVEVLLTFCWLCSS